MKLVIISDTHGQHEKLDLPPGDIIIHAGDWTARDTAGELLQFADWMASLPYEHKIVICGNHDYQPDVDKYIYRDVFSAKGTIYLQDSEIDIDGIKFYGSPWTPTFLNWHWMKERGVDIAERWALIPDDTDVLITHGPPMGWLDTNREHQKVGCEELASWIKSRPNKKLLTHCFGHIHEGYGLHSSYRYNAYFINASVFNEHYKLANAPIVVEI